MPYIKGQDRKAIGEYQIKHYTPSSGGELQYVIALLAHKYLQAKGLNYAHCEHIMGAISGAGSEFYRVVVAPYEDKKIKENGRVYTPGEYGEVKKYV